MADSPTYGLAFQVSSRPSKKGNDLTLKNVAQLSAESLLSSHSGDSSTGSCQTRPCRTVTEQRASRQAVDDIVSTQPRTWANPSEACREVSFLLSSMKMMMCVGDNVARS